MDAQHLRRGLVVLKGQHGDEFGGIARVLGVLGAIHGATLRKIGDAHDHKGTLHVSWVEDPGPLDMASVESAWNGVGEILLNYVFPDGSEVEVEVGATVRTQTKERARGNILPPQSRVKNRY